MSDPLWAAFCIAMALLPCAAVLRFFPWTRTPWLASLLGLVPLVLIAKNNHSMSREVLGTANPPLAEFVAGFVGALLFYEWRDRSGRAYGGYSALTLRQRRIFKIALIAVPSTLVAFAVVMTVFRERREKQQRLEFAQGLRCADALLPPTNFTNDQLNAAMHRCWSGLGANDEILGLRESIDHLRRAEAAPAEPH